MALKKQPMEKLLVLLLFDRYYRLANADDDAVVVVA